MAPPHKIALILRCCDVIFHTPQICIEKVFFVIFANDKEVHMQKVTKIRKICTKVAQMEI